MQGKHQLATKNVVVIRGQYVTVVCIF